MNGNGASSLIHHPCTVCCRPTTMWCSRCQFAWYCSPEHLSSDWPRHRRECVATPMQQSSQLVIQTPPAAPEVMTVSAILFVPNQERPQIINVNCQLTRKPHSSSCPAPLVGDYFQESQPQALVLTQGLNGEPLRFPLHIFYCPMSLQRGSPVNRAIYRITSGAAARQWPGPVVVLKFNGSRRQSYSDASTNDLPALSAYFLAFK
ncbi:uncharacterized protein FOMMEDRAFT_101026 [Fomitiporia mediterranea MF3/22]|uniref:uncharacterized protein n=1 Tax=Fomitiporia mediterranea (strain MF3/22) TaxID=694068 RepID=UPI0004408C41|nr:uncharacterized protein FOMMEDRAFT_101026 [Fomitiporia mediterranea MF3/22]EJD07663.1 hypothetical protein FOMMEDRAFT_101026 [Fomitiporia mediterranea MF3/22]